MRKLIAGIAVAIMLTACTSETPTSTATDTQSIATVRIGLTKQNYRSFDVYSGGELYKSYYVNTKSPAVDTVWHQFPSVDSLVIITHNLRGREYNFIKVKQDSIYKLLSL